MIYRWHAASGSDHRWWAPQPTGAGDRTTARKSVDQTLTGLRAFRSKGFRLAAGFESYRPPAPNTWRHPRVHSIILAVIIGLVLLGGLLQLLKI